LNLGVSRNRFCDFLADPDSRSFSRFGAIIMQFAVPLQLLPREAKDATELIVFVATNLAAQGVWINNGPLFYHWCVRTNERAIQKENGRVSKCFLLTDRYEIKCWTILPSHAQAELV
jgi:hypothetical protein